VVNDVQTDTQDIEQAVRRAFARQADRAPHPGAVLAALERGRRPRRQSRRLVLVGAGALAVVLAAGVGTVVLRHPGQAPAGDKPTAAPFGLVDGAVALRFRPDHLPGLVETSRVVAPDRVLRQWSAGPSQAPEVSLVLRAFGDQERVDFEQAKRTGTPITVAGQRGYRAPLPGGGNPVVLWQPDPNTLGYVLVQMAPGHVDEQLTMLRQVAESVRPDPTLWRPSARFTGGLPGGAGEQPQQLDDYLKHGQRSEAHLLTDSGQEALQVTIGADDQPSGFTPEPGGTSAEVTVRGQRGQYTSWPSSAEGGPAKLPVQQLIVRLADGRWLVAWARPLVRSDHGTDTYLPNPYDQASLVAALDAMVIEPPGAANWLGH
jgi:hypothetical protein